MGVNWQLPSHVHKCEPCYGIGKVRVGARYIPCKHCEGSGLVVEWSRVLAESDVRE